MDKRKTKKGDWKPQALPQKCVHARLREERILWNIANRDEKDKYDFEEYVKREKKAAAARFRSKFVWVIRDWYWKGTFYSYVRDSEWLTWKERYDQKMQYVSDQYDAPKRIKTIPYEQKVKRKHRAEHGDFFFWYWAETPWCRDQIPRRPRGWRITEWVITHWRKTKTYVYKKLKNEPYFGRKFPKNHEDWKPLTYLDFLLTRRRIKSRQRILNRYKRSAERDPYFQIHKVLKWNPIYYHEVASAPSYYKLRLTFDEGNFHMHWQLGVLIILGLIWHNLHLFDLYLNEDISYEMHSRSKIMDEYAVKIDMVQKIRIKDSEIGSYWREGHFTEYLRRKRYYRC